MNPIVLAAAGWVVPGGSYLLMRRYLQFAVFFAAVLAAFGAGLALHGGSEWPGAADLAGLDPFTALAFRGAAVLKMLAGAPWLLSAVFGKFTLAGSRLHEQGSTLLMMAGAMNALAIAGALESRKEAR